MNSDSKLSALIDYFNKTAPLNSKFSVATVKNHLSMRGIEVTYSYIHKTMLKLVYMGVANHHHQKGGAMFSRISEIEVYIEMIGRKLVLKKADHTKETDSSFPLIKPKEILGEQDSKDDEDLKKISAQCVEMAKMIVSLQDENARLKQELSAKKSRPGWADEFIGQIKNLTQIPN